MAVKTENTMAEGIQSIFTDIATLKMTADADIPFLIGLETAILGYLKQGSPQAGQQPGGGMGSPNPMGGQMPGGMGMPPGGGMPGEPPHQMPGMGSRVMSPSPQMGPQTADMDELRRLLGQ